MTLSSARPAEGWHLLLLRAVIVSGATLLLVAPVSGTAGTAAALLAALAGLLLARRAAATHYRLPVLLGAALLLGTLGLAADAVVGSLPVLPRLLGPGTTLAVLEGLTFGLLSFVAVFALRLLALRVPALAVAEIAAVLGSVVCFFQSHRRYPFSQPRFLADWALSNGYDPRLLLVAIGVATLVALAVLLLSRLRPRQALAVLCLLLLLGGAFVLLLEKTTDRGPIASRGTGEDHDRNRPKPPPPPPTPSPKPPPQKPPEPPPPQPDNRNRPKPPEPPPSPQDKKDPGDSPAPSAPPEEDEFDWGMTGPPPQRPVLLALLHDEYAPVEKGYYFRTHAYSRLKDGRMLRAEDRDVDILWKAPAPPLTLPAPKPADIVKELPATLYLLGEHDGIPLLVNPLRLESTDNPDAREFSQTFRLTARVLVHPRREGKVVNLYTDLLARKAGDPSWPAEVRRHYTATPAGDGRYHALAEQIAATLSPSQQQSPLCRALAVRRWMQENLTYDYNPAHRNAADHTASFLFGDRSGYCVHLAHAMALLLRAQDIPTRVAVGYRVSPERRGQRAALMAYSTDGHAWCEVYLEGVGWVVVESATRGRIPPPDPEPDPHEIDHYLSKVRGDTDLALEEEAASPVRKVLLLLPAGSLLLLAAVYAIKVYRRLAIYLAPVGRLYRVGYRAVLDSLADVGVSRREGETWDDFARRVSGWAPELATLTEAHLRGAFGGGAALDRRQWLDLAARVRQRIAATFPRLRRWLGVSNPWSWMTVR